MGPLQIRFTSYLNFMVIPVTVQYIAFELIIGINNVTCMCCVISMKYDQSVRITDTPRCVNNF
jgi:hypothetical protein